VENCTDLQSSAARIALNLGRVATITGRMALASCDQCGPANATIAIPAAAGSWAEMPARMPHGSLLLGFSESV
jgi:hypothetical protein